MGNPPSDDAPGIREPLKVRSWPRTWRWSAGWKNSIAAMYADDRCFIAILLGIGGGPSERLAPVGRQPLAMLRMKPMTERVAHHLVGHDPRMPRVGEAQQTLLAPNGLEHALHIVLTPGSCS